MASASIKKIGSNYFHACINESHYCPKKKILKKTKDFKGKLKSIKNWLLLHNIDKKEIDLALDSFRDNKNHNLAEFGIFGGFLFSLEDPSVSKIEKIEGNVIFLKF